MSEDQSSWHIWSMPLDPKTGLAAAPARRASMSQGDVPVYRGGKDVTVLPANGGTERVLAPDSVWPACW